MAIITVPQLSDNFAYLVIDDGSKQCAVVDCAEADKVIAAAESARRRRLIAVLTTHWHGDHSRRKPGHRRRRCRDSRSTAPAPRADGFPRSPIRSPTATRSASERSRRACSESRRIPTATSRTTFRRWARSSPATRCSSRGCGRVFEGKAATMVASLKKLATLPDSTQVYCGHEYTEKNLRFALTLEPNNRGAEAEARVEREGARREQVDRAVDDRRREEDQSVPAD